MKRLVALHFDRCEHPCWVRSWRRWRRFSGRLAGTLAIAGRVSFASPPPHRRAPCSRRGTRARVTARVSCRQAATRPSRSCPRFTFTVPEGWVNGSDEISFFGLFPDTPANQAEFAASEGLANELFMGPHNSPYFICDAWEDNQGATAAEIVAAVVANDALATSEPIDVTIGGLTGKQIDVQLDPGWTESCPGDPPEFDLGDMRTRAILLDTPDSGVIVIFVGSLHSAGHEAFLAEAMPIIESFQFDLNP